MEESFAFNQKYLGGVSELKPRWKRCAESTDFRLGEALGRKYVERYFPPAAKARAQQLVRNELAAMKEIIEGLSWMGPTPRGGPAWANVVEGRKFVVDDLRSTIGKATDRGRGELRRYRRGHRP